MVDFDVSELSDHNYGQWPVVGPSTDNFSTSNNTFRCTVPIGCFLRYSSFLSILYCVAYLIVLVVGIIGNLCAFAVVWKDRSLHSVYYRFMANLAIADLLVLVFCLPVTLLGNLFGPWILGLFLCKTVAYLQGVSVCASVFTLVAIGIDRFLAICYPMQCQITYHRCRCIIAVIWTSSFSITIPWTIYFRLIPIGKTTENDHLYVCREVWPTESMGTVYFLIANLLICYLLPLLIILMCYVFIWVRVWRRKMPGEGEHNNGMIHRSKIKVIKMLFVVVLVFMISWFPLYAIFTRIKVGEPFHENSMEELIVQISAPFAQWLGASNSCMNPILYAFFNNKFREGFKTVLFGKCCCRSRTDDVKMMSRTKTMAISAKTKTSISTRRLSNRTDMM